MYELMLYERPSLVQCTTIQRVSQTFSQTTSQSFSQTLRGGRFRAWGCGRRRETDVTHIETAVFLFLHYNPPLLHWSCLVVVPFPSFVMTSRKNAVPQSMPDA